jgi:LPXTG-site transpeptidase (sortase) family protein
VRRWLTALGLVVLVSGCSTAPEQPDTDGPADSTPTLDQSPATTDFEPIAIRIPAISLDARDPNWLPLGLQGEKQGQRDVPIETSKGEIEVPPVSDPLKLGWYCPNGLPNCGAPGPGQVGPAVIVGHVNANHKPGVFAKLAQVKAGAIVSIDLAGDRTVTYRVKVVAVVPKQEFPTAAVYGDTDRPTLRLITCGGGDNTTAVDPRTGEHSYTNQTIVYADFDSITKS